MKYFSTTILLLVFIITFTSCEKEPMNPDPIKVTEELKLSDILIGEWQSEWSSILGVEDTIFSNETNNECLSYSKDTTGYNDCNLFVPYEVNADTIKRIDTTQMVAKLVIVESFDSIQLTQKEFIFVNDDTVIVYKKFKKVIE